MCRRISSVAIHSIHTHNIIPSHPHLPPALFIIYGSDCLLSAATQYCSWLLLVFRRWMRRKHAPSSALPHTTIWMSGCGRILTRAMSPVLGMFPTTSPSLRMGRRRIPSLWIRFPRSTPRTKT
ncbi:hypothetical protein Zm00014a_017198 [Zea mays]|uniref:Uncharacterized protein n=1 Tax=Zea mays TaxID=4577 RepID=A0A3L6F023_MAIZE|nr:hypothetical protein Zm00014a_017198 [Zea mays]